MWSTNNLSLTYLLTCTPDRSGDHFHNLGRILIFDRLHCSDRSVCLLIGLTYFYTLNKLLAVTRRPIWDNLLNRENSSDFPALYAIFLRCFHIFKVRISFFCTFPNPENQSALDCLTKHMTTWTLKRQAFRHCCLFRSRRSTPPCANQEKILVSKTESKTLFINFWWPNFTVPHSTRFSQFPLPALSSHQ